jgi:methyl-accepting chemotaxis protein
MSVVQMRREPDVHKLFSDLRALIEEVRLEVHEKLAEKDEPKEPSGDEVQGIITAASLIERRIQQSEEQMAAALEPIRAALQRDATYDQEVAARLERLDTSMEKTNGALDKLAEELRVSREFTGRLTASLEEFTRTLRTPKTRTGVVETPSGPVKMTITERR